VEFKETQSTIQLMFRREMLRGVIGGIALASAVRSWPFRVYSFPSTVKSFEADRITILEVGEEDFEVWCWTRGIAFGDEHRVLRAWQETHAPLSEKALALTLKHLQMELQDVRIELAAPSKV
jgi:hypothetical protein